MGYWSLVEPYWDSVQLDDPLSFLREYSAMPEASRHLLAAHWLYSEVCNGGFHQFFTNPTGVLAPEAVDGLRALGLAELAGIAAQAVAFFETPYPRDQMVRIARLDQYARHSGEPADADEEAWNPFAALDDRFYSDLELGSSDQDRFVQAADAYAARHSPA